MTRVPARPRIGRNTRESLWARLNLGTTDDAAWVAHAPCPQTDPDAFYPAKGEPTRPAKGVCRLCPVRAACLAYALDNREQHGIWGGMSPQERRAVLRRRAADTDEVAA